jgi:hypothetical protein
MEKYPIGKRVVNKECFPGDDNGRWEWVGEWKSYEDIHLQVGEGAMIQWNPKTTPLLPGNIFGGIPSTLTSLVVEIEKDN